MHVAQQIIHNVDQEKPLAFVTLDYEGRFLRRKRLVTDSGEPFLVELPETVSLSSTDGFVLDDKRVVAIKAKTESLLKVNHAELSRIAWHIGVDEQSVKRARLEHVEGDGSLRGRGRAHNGDVLQVGPTHGVGHIVAVITVRTPDHFRSLK